MDFSKVRNIIFFVALTIVSVIFFFLVKPLFYPLFWAAVIASIFHPLYNRIRKKVKSNNFSAAIILVIVLLLVLIPVALMSGLLIKESIDIYAEIGAKGGQINLGLENAFNLIKHNHFIGKFNIDESFWVQKISDITGSLTNYILTSLKIITENSVTFVVMFVIMLYALFFFVRDGEKIMKKAMYLCPIGDKNEMTFYNKFTSTARATLKGTLLLGILQGTLGGIMFYVAGVQGALIWGIVMSAFAILIGSYFIWLPAGIIMLMLGNVWQGIFILAFGLTVVSTIDNILRPVLVGKDIQMHPLLIFISTLGGVVVFGISGFVIGPIITAFMIALWKMYENYYRTDLENN